MRLYNPIAYGGRSVVEAEVPLAAAAKGAVACGPDGRRTPVQILSRDGDRAQIAFVAEVASVGYAVYDVRPAGASASSALRVTDRTLENRIYRLRLDEAGDIVSLVDKRVGRELVAEDASFRLSLIEGNPSNNWPAWEILKQTLDKPGRAIGENVRISIAERGPVRASLRVERSCGDSKFVR